VKIYDKEISSLQKLIAQYEIQYEKGNISLQEKTRIKAQLFSLENEKLVLSDTINSKAGAIKLLIGDSTNNYILPVSEVNLSERNNINKYNIDSLKKIAEENRYDLKVYENQIKYHETDYLLQRSLSIPDIDITARYDHAGSYIQDYKAIGFSIPLPIFNRNQGNIKTSKYQLEQSKLQLQTFSNQLKNEVWKSYVRTLESQKLADKVDIKFKNDLAMLIDGILANYEKRNISMLEFLDYYESYKNTFIQSNQLMNNLFDHYEELNFTTGKEIFNNE
jgi:cobalt-zinc-cadmium efflux system outer membrane protein